MRTSHFLKSILLFFIMALIWFCDAPRNNPLDPESPDYKFLDLTGRVLTDRVPHEAIPNVKVTWDKSLLDYTDNNGFFRFSEIAREAGWLHFESNGYLFDSIYVDWENTTSGLFKYLNAQPHADSVYFYSIIDNRDFNQQYISINAELTIDDQDNDVDSVLIACPSLNFKSFLTYNLSDKTFRGSFGQEKLKIKRPEIVIGHNFYIYVKDTQKNKILVSTQTTKRIIKDRPEIVEPWNGDTTSTTPVLEWSEIDPGFPFHFIVEVYTYPFNPRLVWREENINSDSTNVMVSTPLSGNRYYQWTVWVIDEFQNQCGSYSRHFYAKSP